SPSGSIGPVRSARRAPWNRDSSASDGRGPLMVAPRSAEQSNSGSPRRNHRVIPHDSTESRLLAFVYPGQGSQKVGMGRDFCDAHEVARRSYEEASDALGLDVRTLCFSDEARLALTEFTQPAILATEIAMTRVLQQTLAPTHFAGHSLGEYTALVAA